MICLKNLSQLMGLVFLLPGVAYAEMVAPQTAAETYMQQKGIHGAKVKLHQSASIPQIIDEEKIIWVYTDANKQIEGTMTHEGKPLIVRGNVVIHKSVPVFAKPMLKDEIVTEDALVFIEMPQHQVMPASITSKEGLIGMAVRRNISPNQQILSHDLGKPHLVKAKDIVTVEAIQGSLSVSMQGTAMNDGAMGEVITIKNNQTSKILSGKVTGPSTVTISL